PAPPGRLRPGALSPAGRQLEILPPRPRLSVIGSPVPGGSGFLPSTDSWTPPGLPSPMSTGCRKVHCFEVPPATIVWDKYPAGRGGELHPAVLDRRQVNGNAVGVGMGGGGGGRGRRSVAGAAVAGPGAVRPRPRRNLPARAGSP